MPASIPSLRYRDRDGVHAIEIRRVGQRLEVVDRIGEESRRVELLGLGEGFKQARAIAADYAASRSARAR